MARPVSEIMQRRCREFFRTMESEVRRKLDVIGRPRIESTIAAYADYGAAVLQDEVSGFWACPRSFFDAGRLIGRDAINLRRMKHGIMLHDPDHFPTVLGLFVFNLVGLGEEDGRGPLAFADLPVFALRLLVG